MHLRGHRARKDKTYHNHVRSIRYLQASGILKYRGGCPWKWCSFSGISCCRASPGAWNTASMSSCITDIRIILSLSLFFLSITISPQHPRIIGTLWPSKVSKKKEHTATSFSIRVGAPELKFLASCNRNLLPVLPDNKTVYVASNTQLTSSNTSAKQRAKAA